MIKVKLEPKNLRDTRAENCVICGDEGRYWHEPTNSPLCKFCSEVHDLEILDNSTQLEVTNVRIRKIIQNQT